MQEFRKGLAAFFAILFVMTAVMALFLFNLERKAFSAEIYQQALANQGFYDHLPAVLAGALVSITSDQNQMPLTMRGLSVDGWEAFLRSLLPNDALRSMGDGALTSLFTYLNQESDAAYISLAPLKASMTGDAGVQAVFVLLQTQPDCTIDQLARMTFSILQEQQLQFCNPGEALRPILTPVVQLQLEATAAALPNEVTLAKVDTAAGQIDPRTRLKILRLVMRFSPLLPLGILLVLTVLAVRSLKNWLDWWGIPFVVTGSIAALIALVGGPAIRLILQEILANRMPAYVPVILLDYASGLAAAMAGQFLKPVIWQGLLLACIGMVMSLISFVIKRNEK